MAHKRADTNKKEQNARRVRRRKRRQRQLYEVILGISALRDQRDQAQEELRRTLQVAEAQATAALHRTDQLLADVQQRADEVSQVRINLADITANHARVLEELTMARASLREHLASREGFAVQREEQTTQIQALMQTNAEQAADAERHRLELHAVRVAAADTGAEYARLQAAHRDLRQEHHDLRTSAALYRNMLAAAHDDHLDHLRNEATPSARTREAYRRRG